jgi:hypothetical protein
MASISSYRTWRKTGLLDEDGIVVASDINHEWLLSWWWENYSRYNSLPVAFVDFGMSQERKRWCQERGIVIDMIVDDDFIVTKEQMNPLTAAVIENESGTWFWGYRQAWFKIPCACMQSPFRKSLWMDLDCEVCGSLEEVFQRYGEPLSLVLDAHSTSSHPVYNTGVIAFKRGISIIEEWADACIEQNHLSRGNQDLLSRILHQHNMSIDMPDVYNWSRCSSLEKNPEAIIVHWHGPHGKKCLQKMLSEI